MYYDACAAECWFAMADGGVGYDVLVQGFGFHELPLDWVGVEGDCEIQTTPARVENTNYVSTTYPNIFHLFICILLFSVLDATLILQNVSYCIVQFGIIFLQ